MAVEAAAGETRLRDPGPLWAWMRFFVLLTILAYSVASVSGVLTWLVISGVLAVNMAQANVIDAAFSIGVFGTIGLYYLSAFCTARVTYRLMKNAHALGSDREELTSPGWAVGWYFIPFANLVMPVRAVGQIWRTTFAHRGEPDKGAGVIGFWWGAFIISGIVLMFANFLARDAAEQGEGLYAALAAGYILRALAAILLLVVFGTLVKAQKTMSRVAEVFD